MSKIHLGVFLLLWFLMCLAPVPAAAEINAELTDEYLESQFDWAMLVDAQEVRHYLNYDSSLLKPVTKIAINFKIYPHGEDKKPPNTKAKVYEEFWYSKGALIGLRRRNQLNIDPDKIGIVIIPKTVGRVDQSSAIAGGLVRLLLDLQFLHIHTSVVLIPLDRYDHITANLANYHFFRGPEPEEGKQMSIHTRSEPAGRDEYFYLR